MYTCKQPFAQSHDRKNKLLAMATNNGYHSPFTAMSGKAIQTSRGSGQQGNTRSQSPETWKNNYFRHHSKHIAP